MRNAEMGTTLLAIALVLGATRASAEIVSTSYHRAETIDQTKVGAIDWCVYRIADTKAPTFVSADSKKGGSGIARKIGIRGRIGKVEATRFTGVGWGWTDGSKRPAHSHRQGDQDGMGIRAWIGRDSALLFEFAAAPAGERRQAHLIVRCDGKIKIIARQGDRTREIESFGGGKKLGVAVARYHGEGTLTIELVSPGRRDVVVRGFATALSGAVDYEAGVPRIPTRQELAAKRAERLGEIDFLKAAEAFAECMIKFGRDRYGKVHSPLFAVLLTREAEPRIGPQPYFDRPSPYNTSNMKTPFRKYNFNRCLNYPGGLGGEGPHKVTFFGCDVYEDQDLYKMLIDLTRITGKARYKAEAEKALTWWFTHTLGPADLYPWGEHLGWDFEQDCPTYFEGPSKHLYAACYHEIKDDVPFLGFLAKLPAARPGERTYLERYALGVWNAHYWDKARGVYCRHGDYTGKDDRKGSYAGFPAHQGAHLRLWVTTYLTSGSDEVKKKVEQILNTVLDVQIARTRKYGFVPFTFDPDYKGRDPGQSAPGQSIRLAHHAADLSARMRKANAGIAAKLEELAVRHLGRESFALAAENMEMYLATGDRGYLRGGRSAAGKPAAAVKDLSKADTPEAHGREIIRLIQWYRKYKDQTYLTAARRQARLAYVRFMDDSCPLPKAYSGSPRKTVAGEAFPDFYFRGAKLMHTFALVGEAEAETRKAGAP